MTKLFSIALVGLISLVLAPPLHSQTNDLRDAFAKAYALYSNGSPAQAKELFQKTTDGKFRLADYSLYYLAMIAFNESKWDESRQYLTQLRQRFPQSVWSAPGETATRQDRYRRAEIFAGNRSFTPSARRSGRQARAPRRSALSPRAGSRSARQSKLGQLPVSRIA